MVGGEQDGDIESWTGDISYQYHENLRNNNRQKTEGGDKQRGRAVLFHILIRKF